MQSLHRQVLGSRPRYPHTPTLQQAIATLICRVKPAQLQHWTQCKGVFDFVGLKTQQLILLGATGAKFQLTPTGAQLIKAVGLSVIKLSRAFKLNLFFQEQSRQTEEVEAQGTVREVLAPPCDIPPFEQAQLHGAKRRRLQLQQQSRHFQLFIARSGSKTWEPEDPPNWNVVAQALTKFKQHLILAATSKIAGERLGTNLRSHQPLKALQQISSTLYIGQPDKFNALIVNSQVNYRRDVELHLVSTPFYKKLLNVSHQYHSLRHWQAIKDKYSKVLDLLSSSKGDFGFDEITQWGLYKLKRYLFLPFAQEVTDFNETGHFYYAKFIGAYKLHKVVHINMLSVQDLSGFDTSTIPIRPIIAATNPGLFLPHLVDMTISILGHLLKHCYFYFNEQQYQQTKGNSDWFGLCIAGSSNHCLVR